MGRVTSSIATSVVTEGLMLRCDRMAAAFSRGALVTTATGTEITSEHGHATISSAKARYVQVPESPPNASGTIATSNAARKTSGV